MKTKHLSITCSLLMLTAILSGCTLTDVVIRPYEAVLRDQVIIGSEYGHYYRPATYDENFTDLRRSHPNNSQRTMTLETTGEQRLLVIPVDFTDYRAERLDEGPVNSRRLLQNAFFGESATTQWESLASFYHRSSYQQLAISGFVSDWYQSNEVAASIASSGSKTVTTERILKAAVEWYRNTYDDINSFDANDDGYLDAVFLVYAAPYVNNNSVFWAFTSFDTGVDGSLRIGNPIANAYVWASYHFLNVYRQKGDPHTFIHEFGHLLGLTDYYNTSAIPVNFSQLSTLDSDFKRYQYLHGPTGKVDMMDYSIGDHTTLSKMLLNWTKPYVVTGQGTITIAPFVSSGDTIIIANDWNGKAFDEYLALEFYAPLGLNYVDSERAYGHDHARLMGNFGLKVYHVDARASYHATNNDLFLGYEDDFSSDNLPPINTSYRTIAHTNTYSTTINEHLIYRLLEKGESKTFLQGSMATNATLYYEGDTFGITDFSDFTFNDGTSLPFTFKIDAMNRYQATITFSAKIS